jgi:hypothetical protein
MLCGKAFRATPAGPEPGMKYKGDNVSLRGAKLAKITQIRN